MVHSEHNKSKGGSSFALIILGALLLFLAPQESTIQAIGFNNSVMALIGGIIIGGIGFYLKFIRRRAKD